MRRMLLGTAIGWLAFAGVGAAGAAPGIQAVYTDYTAGGTPLSINIVGSGFTCADCGPPRVSLGGLSLTVKAHSTKVITAVLPQPLAAGDYTLAVTVGPPPRAEVGKFSLSVMPAMVAATGVGTVPTVRSTSGGSGPAPGLKRPADLATRSAGPLSRNSRNSVKTTGGGAGGQMKGGTSVATVDPTPSSTPGGIYLPEYSTAFGDYAMYKVSTGLYDTTTRANSAFGYAALLNTTDGSYNNAFGFYSLHSNIDGGNNNAFGNWTLLYNTSGTSNNAFGHQALYSNTTGNNNSAFGHEALYRNTTGQSNTATGAGALRSNTTGSVNTASGASALNSNTTGYDNTASGVSALAYNTTGYDNTASGYRALFSNTTGANNTASGVRALYSNSTGGRNTANGVNALTSNTTGSRNTASGVDALYFNTTGDENTAIGDNTLSYNTFGSRNTASGYGALYSLKGGSLNTAFGWNALHSGGGTTNTAVGASALHANLSGYNSTAIGYMAGSKAGSMGAYGNNTIYIGANNYGDEWDEGVIRIGSPSFQTQTYIAGIRWTRTFFNDAVPVLIDSDGQLGTVSSSRRYKEDIQPMGDLSERLFALRPVTFRYKKPYEDGSKPVQFGLIAEEVAEVFPELAVYGEDGQPETVSYHLLATLLLNELQKEHSVVSALKVQNEALARKFDAQTTELSSLRQEVALLAKLVGGMEKGKMVASAK